MRPSHKKQDIDDFINNELGEMESQPMQVKPKPAASKPSFAIGAKKSAAFAKPTFAINKKTKAADDLIDSEFDAI